MSQTFQTFDESASGDNVRDGLLYQRTRTDTLRSSFEGTSFPSSPVIGQVCWRSDTERFYICRDNDPSDVWERIIWGTPIGIPDGGTGATTASGARTALGLGTAAVLNSGTGSGDLPTITNADARYLKQSNNLSDLASPATARTNLGLGNAATGTIGTDVQAYDADILKADTTDQLTVGYTVATYDHTNSGTGTVTPTFANGNAQEITINGSFTLAAPSGEGIMRLEVTNDGTGGHVITFSGFDYIDGTYDDTASAISIFEIDTTGAQVKLYITSALTAA